MTIAGKKLISNVARDITINDIVIKARKSLNITLEKYKELLNNDMFKDYINKNIIVVYNTNIDIKITTKSNKTTTKNATTTNNVKLHNNNVITKDSTTKAVEPIVKEKAPKSTTKRSRKRSKTTKD